MTSAEVGVRPVSGRRFYTAMAVLIAAYVLYGFGRTYAAALAPPGLPLWVHIHGAAFTSWIFLFIAQTWLVSRRELALHRRLGWTSCGLVAAMVVLGVATTILCVRRGAVPPIFTPGLMLALDFLGLAGFVSLFAAAVALRRNAEWHKRLMLCATILLSTPAVPRVLPMATFGKTAPLVILAFPLFVLSLGAAFDLMTRRRIHPAYGWGAATIALSILLGAPLGFSSPMLNFVKAITA